MPGGIGTMSVLKILFFPGIVMKASRSYLRLSLFWITSIITNPLAPRC